jgi:magnesium-transporting ATPase (P-type)
MNKLRGLKVTCDPPNKDPENFSGNIDLLGGNVHKTLDITNFLPKGCKMVDSDQIDAIVIFTGEHTKLQMNQFEHSWKWSQLDITINYITLINLILILVMTFTCWGGNIYYNNIYADHDYTYLSKKEVKINFESLATFFLHFRMMIPFESVIIIEICRAFFTNFVESDHNLYHEGSGNLVKVQNPAIIEELGHIKYLFCDKTGTMTQNKLEFREMRVTKKANL